MKRALILPVSAAALGVCMALGVFALKRAVVNAWDDQTFEVRIDRTRAVAVEAGDVRFREEVLRDVLETVSQEVREAVEADRDLTEAERAEVEAALARMEAKLGHLRARDGIAIPGTPDVPEGPAGASAPEVGGSEAPEAPRQPSGN